MASLVKRNEIFYIQYRINGKLKRQSTATSIKKIAKEKLREFESKQFRHGIDFLPTKTKLPEILQQYTQHIRATKTPKSSQTDIYYLRSMFGDICNGLRITSRKSSIKTQKRPPKASCDKRFKDIIIEANYIEDIKTSDIFNFIAHKVQSRGLAPKTANRYREIAMRLFNWAMKEAGVKMPSDKNPVCDVQRYKEKAPQIRFLSLKQIDEQLEALRDKKQLQTMVAMLIYGGFRREEILWLTHNDIDLKSGAFGIIRIRAKEINGEYWQPKTKVNRAVPISSTLRKYLDSYAPKPSKGGWLFPSPKSITHYDPDNFSRDLRQANKKAGLQWSCLDYRHTFGSQLAIKGESLYKISALMGNSPEICRRHYAALIPEALTNCVEFHNNITPCISA